MKIEKSLRTFVLTAILTIAILVIGSQQSSADQNFKGILGSWVVTITEGPGTPDLPDWYSALVTFSPGGGLVATITDSQLSTGHGSWSKKNKRKVSITVLLRQFDTAGNFVGTLKARATLTVDDNSSTFSSDDYQFEFFDINGNPTGFVGVGTAQGTRIQAEPLP